MMKRLMLWLGTSPTLSNELPNAAKDGRALHESCLSNAVDRSECVGVIARRCKDRSPRVTHSTFKMITCSQIETRIWDTWLNAGYAAQRALIAFRDAQCSFEYALWGMGSVRAVAGVACIAGMTDAAKIELMDLQERPQ